MLSRIRSVRAGALLTGVLWLGAAGSHAAISVSPTSVSALEGGGSVTVTLLRDGGKPREFLRYSTIQGTATPTADYTAASGVCIELAPNNTSLDILVPLTNDSVAEPTEFFEVTLASVADGACGPGTGATRSTIAAATATVAIIDDDTPDVIQFATAGVAVGEPAGTAALTLTRTGSGLGALTVDVATTSGTATAGSDYVTSTTTVTWANGDTTAKTVSVAITNDATVESGTPETLFLNLGNPSANAVLGAVSTATVTIIDNDVDVPDVVGLSQADAGTSLSAAGLGTGTVTPVQSTTDAIGRVIGQSPAAGIDVDPLLTGTVDLTVSDGTRVPDVTGQTQTDATTLLTAAGLTTGTVGSAADAMVPAGVVISQSPPANTVTPVEPGSSVDLVVSTGPAPKAIFAFAGDVSIDESAGTASVAVTRTNSGSGAVSVSVATSDGSATAGSDYASMTTILTWPDGDTSTRSVVLTIHNDAVVEGVQAFGIRLSNASPGSEIGVPDTATITIIDNDVDVPDVVGLSQADAGTSLSAAGLGTGTITPVQSTTATIGQVIGQSPAAGIDVDPLLTGTVDLTVSDGTRVPDVTGQTQTDATTLLTAAGLTTGTVGSAADAMVPAGVVISQSPAADVDTPVEPGSAVDLVISSGPAAAATLSISGDITVSEAAGTVTLSVSRTSGSSGAVTVDVSTQNGTATAGSDYSSLTTTLSWADGDTADKTVDVTLLDDDLFEGALHESFDVTLSNASSGAGLGSTTTATVSIVDDDAAPALAFATGSASTGESVGTFVISVIRSGNAAGAVSVRFATISGTASAPADFVAAAGTLNWADGDSAPKSISLQIVGDAIAEAPATESFAVTLSDPTGGATVVSPAAVTVEIVDDDGIPAVTDLAGPDQTLLSASGAPVQVQLAAASDEFAAYQWLLRGTPIGTGPDPTVTLPLGVHTIDLTASDGAGVPVFDSVTITVTRVLMGSGGLSLLPGLDATERSVAIALDNLCPRLNFTSTLTADQEDLLQRCAALMEHDNDGEQGAALDQISGRPITTMMTNLLEISVLQDRNIASRLRAVRQGDRGISVQGLALNVNGEAIPDAALQAVIDGIAGSGAGDEQSALGVFVMGNVFVGDKNETDLESGFDFTTTSMTAGVDYRFGDGMIAGAALGYGKGDADFAHNPGGLDTESVTATAFGSYYGAFAYADAMASMSWSTHEERRQIDYADALGQVTRMTRGEADGRLWSVGTELGLLVGDATWRINPRISLFYANAEIDRFREYGAGGLDLLFAGQDEASFTVSAGGSVAYSWRTAAAVWTPEVRFDFVTELEDGASPIYATFAHDPFAGTTGAAATPLIVLLTDAYDAHYLSLGLNLSADFDNGISVALDWQTAQDRADVSAQSHSIGVRFERSF